MTPMGCFVLRRAFWRGVRTKLGVFCSKGGVSRGAQNKRWGFCVEEQQFWYYNGKHKKAHSGEELTVFVRVYKKATPEGVANMFYVWKI